MWNLFPPILAAPPQWSELMPGESGQLGRRATMIEILLSDNVQICDMSAVSPAALQVNTFYSTLVQ